MLITDEKLYDRLKWVAQIFLPALGALVFALSGVWGFDTTGKIVGSIAAVDAFLGLLLKKSNDNYAIDLATLYQAEMSNPNNFDGDLYISPGEGENPDLTAAWNEHPDEFKDKETVTLRVQNVESSRLAQRPPNPQRKG
jgi:hypothetical protein